MKKLSGSWVLVLFFVMGVSDGLAQQQRLDAATKVLVPSSARTAAFNSFLAIINLDSQDNAITITARRADGSVIGTPRSIVLSPSGKFRSTDILGELGGGLGEFGPITVESTNGRVLSAVSEVASVQGPAGFFPGVNTSSAWMQGYIAEVIDTGEAGSSGTFRTNLGLNTVTGTAANVTVTLRGATGQQLASANFVVPGNGLTQFRVRDSLPPLTGGNGYLTITSNQPIHAWASKIENGTGDPSFQIGIGALSGTVISQVMPGSSEVRNYFLFVGLALAPAIAFLVLKIRGLDFYPDDESLASQTI